jgi:hypothetical protein
MSQPQFAKDASVLAFLSEKRMQTQNSAPMIPTERKFSQQMRAVLLVFNSDPFLMEAVAPFVNFETETIHWEKIQKLPLSSGHKSAVRWAYGIWTDEMPKGNCFGGALNMSPFLQVAVLEALCLRWGLRGGN